MDRISKANYYLDIAQTVLERATCLRRVYGAIIVKNDEIISTGYNGAPRGRANCVDLGYCSREAMQVPRESGMRLCRSVHAERRTPSSRPRLPEVGREGGGAEGGGEGCGGLGGGGRPSGIPGRRRHSGQAVTRPAGYPDCGKEDTW